VGGDCFDDSAADDHTIGGQGDGGGLIGSGNAEADADGNTGAAFDDGYVFSDVGGQF